MSPHRPDRDETLEALAERLRRLPPPPVPAGLEARLLAAVPAAPPTATRRLRRGAATAVLLAAASTLFALRLPNHEPAPQTAPPTADAPTLWRYEQALRDSDGDAGVAVNRAVPPFEWPVEGPETVFASERLAGVSQ